MNLDRNGEETHKEPFLVLGASNTLECVLALQLLIGKCAELWDTGDTSGSSTSITDDKLCAPIGAQVAPLLVP
jgi:hypothetical protein